MSTNEDKVKIVLRRNDEVIWDRVDGTTVLCHTGTVEFFRVNETGAVIWELCDGCTIEELIEAMCARYPTADPERIATLVRDYVPLLEKERLLEASPTHLPELA